MPLEITKVVYICLLSNTRDAMDFMHASLIIYGNALSVSYL